MSSPHPVFISFVYASLNRQKCTVLWDDLRSSNPPIHSPWIVIGDFNAILSSSEMFSGRTKGRRCLQFGNFVEEAELHDLGFRGSPFTWHRGALSERLDRVLGNGAWICKFPNSLVTHLPKIKSDHRPLLLNQNLEVFLPRGRLFRFLAGWIEHPAFDDFINDKWDFTRDMADSLSKLTLNLKEWNKQVYGHITSKKRHLVHKIANVQSKMDVSGSNQFAQEDLSLRQELENVPHHEELLWKQKARYDWLHLGDRNKRFFHSQTLQRRKSNRITAIRNNDGEWIFDPEAIEAEANFFFQKLYEEGPDSIDDFPPSNFPQLEDDDVNFLGKPVTNEEINIALFDMAHLKAPGSDGFHALFFQKQWNRIGGAVCDWVRKVFNGELFSFLRWRIQKALDSFVQ
ncbi:hypothetical protein PVK06_030528 [Gossypium arboreum]|uniref:Endonuclease/exonuclease/phosphatase domain-containing protein n=1 Tax=Gossypium arboreum TaxID=29729 RepID=A0ABR0NQW9_GOSAR|nr:hypothetical protein PVK06_030528 [Gossypium arboreum]